MAIVIRCDIGHEDVSTTMIYTHVVIPMHTEGEPVRYLEKGGREKNNG